MKNRKILQTIGLVIILVFAAASIYILMNKSAESDNAPPVLTIGANKFLGQLDAEIGCRIPGSYAFTEENIRNYVNPASVSASDKNDLLKGAHFYHAEDDMTVKEILDSIIPTSGNKILLAYYSPGLGGLEKGFYLYPSIAGNLGITNPNSFEIPGNNGFVIISCKDSYIWKVKNENQYAEDLSPILTAIENGWISVPAIEAFDPQTDIYQSAYRVKSLWKQTGEGFNFRKVENIASFALDDDFYMLWIKFSDAMVRIGDVAGVFEEILNNLYDEIETAVADFISRIPTDEDNRLVPLAASFEELNDLIVNAIRNADDAYEDFEETISAIDDPIADEVLDLETDNLEDFNEQMTNFLTTITQAYTNFAERMRDTGIEGIEKTNIIDIFIGTITEEFGKIDFNKTIDFNGIETSNGKSVLDCEDGKNIASAVDYFVGHINIINRNTFPFNAVPQQTGAITQPSQNECHYYIQNKRNGLYRFSYTFRYQFNGDPRLPSPWIVTNMEAVPRQRIKNTQ